MKTIHKHFSQLFLIVAILFTFSLSAWGEKVTTTFNFSTISGSVQYANETHKLTDDLTINIVDCHINTQLRIYSSASNNGVVTSNQLPGPIKSMSFNMGYKKDNLLVYGSTDGSTWKQVGSIETTTTSYKDYSIDFTENYTYFKLDVEGTNQIRIASMSVTYDNGEEPETPTETLNTPTNITTIAKSQTINVTWDAVTETAEGSNISSVTYTLYDSNDTKLGETTETSYTITELAPSTTYNFSIEASKDGFITSEKRTFTATTETNTVENIAEFLERRDESELTITGEVTVTAQSSNSTRTWIQDESGALMILRRNNPVEYAEGDKITNLKGTYNAYANVPQLIATELPTAVQGIAPVAKVITLTEASDNLHHKVSLSGLKCTAITNKGDFDVLSLSNGTDTIDTYENYFNLDFSTLYEQSELTITAIVGRYYNTIQLYIISIDNIVLPKIHTINFHTGENSFESYSVANNTSLKTTPPTEPTSCNINYSEFVGWTTSTTTNGTTQPELFDFTTPITSNLNLYPVFAQTIPGKTIQAWTLVTDASTLAVGDQIVIAAKGYDYAMSTTQNGNNRAQAAITKSENNITFKDGVQILTLQAGKTSGTFAFYTGSGYLYAASSSKNYLKTETTLSDNSSWTITIASTGVATIKATGSNTRNWMRYNSSNNPPIFSCYGSGQADICIYKRIETTTEEATAWTICYVPTTNIAIESGDEEEVNETTKYNTLIIKSNGDQAGQINVTNGSISANKVILEKTIDASRYFFFSLPFDCNIADIEAFDVTAPTTPLDYYDDYTIFYYDQATAANNKGAMGSKAWVEIEDKNTILNANQGYIIGYLVNEGIATIKFKSSTPQTISAPSTTTLDIDGYTWYTPGDVRTANGWNLIGMPYYQKPNNSSLSADINVYFATIPNVDGKTYTQTTFADANIAPFTSFFVQTTEAPTFTIAAQSSAAPMLRAKGKVSKAVISLADANGVDDKTTIINNPNNTNDYEIGHDLAKWIGYAARPQIYSIQGDDILAFNSLAIDNSTIIPLGVYAHADGEYTFRLSEKSVDDLEGWELYDNETGKTTRLANEDLSIYLEQGTHEGRFEIRLQQRVPTVCDNSMGDMTTWTANGTLNINNLPADAVVYIYDAVGRMIYAANNNSTAFNYTFTARGVYNIVVRSADNTISFKTIY